MKVFDEYLEKIGKIVGFFYGVFISLKEYMFIKGYYIVVGFFDMCYIDDYDC